MTNRLRVKDVQELYLRSNSVQELLNAVNALIIPINEAIKTAAKEGKPGLDVDYNKQWSKIKASTEIVILDDVWRRVINHYKCMGFIVDVVATADSCKITISWGI